MNLVDIGRTVADIERISLILESADRWDQPIRSGYARDLALSLTECIASY